MFDLLKKKIGGFINALARKEQEKPVEKPVEAEEQKETEKEIEKPIEQPIVETISQAAPTTPSVKKEPEVFEVKMKEEVKEEPQPEKAPFSQPVPQPTQPREAEEKFKPKLGLVTRLKSVFSHEVTISEGDVKSLLEEFEMSLLESDVSLDTANFLAEDLRKRIVGKRVSKAAVGEAVKQELRGALLDAMHDGKMDLLEKIKEKNAGGEPFVILFVGPNGMGKTTSIAKMAHWFKQKNISSVFSASDTFRAAAQEQIQEHAKRLGIRVIAHQYGADPAAVAFDAVAHARANKISVVLIDTAGRQETAYNLVKEMEKLVRVIKPDLKIFVGEAIAGHALVEQVREFHKAIGLDAIMLTKMDADAKGGSALSVVHETKIPIIFVGLGQAYSDFREFDAQWFVGNLLN
jgi:fused signal recognition particle receptor